MEIVNRNPFVGMIRIFDPAAEADHGSVSMPPLWAMRQVAETGVRIIHHGLLVGEITPLESVIVSNFLVLLVMQLEQQERAMEERESIYEEQLAVDDLES